MKHSNPDFKTIKCYKPRGTSTTIYVVEFEDGRKLELYANTYKRLVEGKTTIDKILKWRSSRKSNSHSRIATTYKNPIQLNKREKIPFGYKFNKHTQSLEIVKRDMDTVRFVFYCHDRLHLPVSFIAKLTQLKYEKIQLILKRKEKYQL